MTVLDEAEVPVIFCEIAPPPPLYSHEKRNLSNGQLWKIWKETVFIELCSFFIDLLALEQDKLCPGVGIFVSFFPPGGRGFALRSCPGGGDFDEKN